MSIPSRRRTGEAGTFFVTSRTWQSRQLFRTREICEAFLAALLEYRDEGHYALHAFVLMPEHFHVLITPAGSVSLERAVQLIKGGSAHGISKARNLAFPVWQRGFTDHRIREFEDYQVHVRYIEQNAVKRGIVSSAPEYEWSSARRAVALDDVPQRLKPLVRAAVRHG